jgi:hypothetical protein
MDTKYIDITALLRAHSQELLELREEFLKYALTTRRADRSRFENAIAGTYAFAGSKPPQQVIWLSSPLDAVIAASLWIAVLNAERTGREASGTWGVNEVLLCSRFRELLPGIDAEPPEFTGLVRMLERPKIASEGWLTSTDGIQPLETWVRNIEHPLLSDEECKVISSRAGRLINEHLYSPDAGADRELWFRTWKTVHGSLEFKGDEWSALGEKLFSGSGEDTAEHLWMLEARTIAGEFHFTEKHHSPLLDAFPVAIHKALELLGIRVGKMPPMEETVRSGGWWWPFEDICFACDNPVALNVDQRLRLHHDQKMAICFESGWGGWALRGVMVPESVIQNEFGAVDIDQQANAEIRSVMIERFGLAKYILESGAQEIHRDKFGVLYSKLLAGAREPVVMVQVTNKTPEPDGSFRTYFLRVPPDIRTAKEAIAWTFGLEEDQYSPGEES